MRKLFTILMLILVSVSLSATGAKESQLTTDQPVKLTWLMLEYWNADNVIQAYKQVAPNVDIEVEKVSFGDLLQQNQIRLAAKSGNPDIVSVDVPLVASYGARNWLYPLDGSISAEDKKAWIPASVEAGTYNGKLLAAPQNTSTQVLFVNYDLLKDAGITVPGPDDRWTWEQVLDAAQKVKTEKVWGLTWEQVTATYQLLPLIQSLGGKAIGDDGLTVEGIIDSPEWIKALTFYGDCFNSYNVSPKSDIPAADMFAAGNLAMFVGGPWDIRRFAGSDLGFEWGVSRNPYFEGGVAVTPTGSWHFGVNASSSHPNEAADFVAWLTEGEGSGIWWSKDSYDFPAQLKLLDSIETEPSFQEFPLAYMKTAAQEAKVNPVPRPVTPGYLEYDQILGNVFSDIRNGADPATVLKKAASQITIEMEKYRH